MKNFAALLLCIATFINTSLRAQNQEKCNIEAFKAIIASDLDSLTKGTSFIIRNKKVEDMPYYEAFMFTKNVNQASYFKLYSLSPEATIRLSIIDYQNNVLVTDSIITQNERTYLVDPSFKGEFKVILYSSNPDNKCALLSEFMMENNSKRIKTPPFKTFNQMEYKNQGLDLLKEYEQALNGNKDFPLYKEYSYVLTKSASYYFEVAGDLEVKYKLYTSKKELIPLKKSADFPNMYYCTPDQTGIYYIIVYKKAPIVRNTSLSMYKKYN